MLRSACRKDGCRKFISYPFRGLDHRDGHSTLSLVPFHRRRDVGNNFQFP